MLILIVLNIIVFLNFNGVDYRCIIFNVSKNEPVNVLDGGNTCKNVSEEDELETKKIWKNVSQHKKSML